MGRPDRRLALRRRRRPARPGDRAPRRRPRHLRLPARAAVHAARRASRSGRATSAARPAEAPASTTRPAPRSASSASTTGPPPSSGSTTSSRTPSPVSGDRPPNVEHVVAINRGPLVEELGAPAPLSPRAVEVAIADGALLVDARTNEQFDEAHIPGAISASAYDTGFATKVGRVVAAGRRADRRRRLRRLRAGGRRPAGLGRPARARIPRRRDDLVALRGAAGPAHRDDRPGHAGRAPGGR